MIIGMTDLPQSDDPSGQIAPPVVPQVSSAVSSGNKEVLGGAIERPEGLQDATGQEVELPKEVSSAGVRFHPTTVPIPPPVTQLGVQPAGHNVPVQTVPTVSLPLTDEQIAAGLQLSVVNSLRWLSEWCVKRLKQIQMKLKGSEHVRVKV
jgi:hypothetical protein